jgi:hypothetical protein
VTSHNKFDRLQLLITNLIGFKYVLTRIPCNIFRACLAGLLFGFESGFSRRALPNIFLEKSFFSKKAEEPAYGFSKMALVPPKEPLRRSHAKHPLSLAKQEIC